MTTNSKKTGLIQFLLQLNLPNALTIMRVLLIPVFVLIFYLPFSGARFFAGIIYFLACVTDYLDGYLARAWQQSSKLGAFLDPVADKLLVAVALVLIISDPNLPYLAIPAAIIIGREIVISALREWMAELGNRESVTVTYLGKVKTLLQMSAIFFLIAFNPSTGWYAVIFGYISLYVAALLTFFTMLSYIRAAWQAR